MWPGFPKARAVSRRYRNRRIGAFLKEMAANGSPAPLFETDNDRLSFVIRLPRHPWSLVPTVGGGGVTGEVERLLRAVVGKMPRQQIQSALGLKGEEHFRTAYLKPPLISKVIEMTLPDTPRSSKLRYRLTTLGQRWLDAHSKPAAQD